MSSHPKKLLHNAVVHCEGIQIGTRETGSGQGYCKIIDEDGDAATLQQMPVATPIWTGS
jgi:hypothetical protein